MEKKGISEQNLRLIESLKTSNNSYQIIIQGVIQH